jgi:hypothetical protein
VRQIVGDATPIAVTLDLHANCGDLFFQAGVPYHSSQRPALLPPTAPVGTRPTPISTSPLIVWRQHRYLNIYHIYRHFSHSGPAAERVERFQY